jgi:site-specific DNA-methyltransferase (adenine-specific)
LFICDLPYGCLQQPKGSKEHKQAAANGGQMNGCAWDIKIDLEKLWEQIKRLAKNDNTVVLMFCTTKFGIDLINSNPNWFRYDLVWDKQRGTSFLTANKMPLRSHEMIYVFSKQGSNYNRIDITGEPYFKKSKNEIYEQNGVVRIESNNNGTRCVISVIEQHNTAGHNGKKHPTAKPVELYKWLISRYSKEGDKVLDPTFGSCNSGLVCKELKRNYIGIEMNKEFFDKANHSLIQPA